MQRLDDFGFWLMDKMMWNPRDEKGQTLVEYGLIVSFIIVVSVVIVSTIGAKIPSFYTSAASKLHS